MKKLFIKIKESRFCKGLIIYSSVIMVFFAALICILCLFLGAYEKNLPENVAARFASRVDRETVNTMLLEALVDISAFEEKDEVLAQSVFGLNGDLHLASSKKADEYTTAKPVFRLFSDDVEVGKITLTKTGRKAAFGLTEWKVNDAVLYPDAVMGNKTDYIVTLPKGAVLKVNGKDVDDKYLSSSTLYTGLCFAAIADKDGILCDIYTIPKMFTKPEIKATYGGNETVFGIDSPNGSGTVLLDWYAFPGNCYTLSAPTEAYITVNGERLDPSLCLRKEAVADANSFDAASGKQLPEISYYRLLKTEKAPEIKALISGKNLDIVTDSESADFVCAFTDELRYTLEAAVPRGAVLTVNGVEVGNEYLAGSEDYKSLAALKRYAGVLPQADIYIISGLYTEPDCKAALDGKELELCYGDADGRSLLREYYGVPSEALLEAQTETAKQFSEAYFLYASKGVENLDEHCTAVLDLMYRGTPGYKKISETKRSFFWANTNQSVKIDKMDAGSFIPLGDNCYFCRVGFSVTLKNYRDVKMYEGTISLVYVKYGNEWLAADMYIESTTHK